MLDLLRSLRNITEELDIDPKYLLGIAHKQENVKAIWWYNLSTGEWKVSKDIRQPHHSEFFKGLAFEPGSIRGRLLDYKGKNILIVYLTRSRTAPFAKGKITDRQLTDIIHKLSGEPGLTIDGVIDQEGNDLSYMLESIKQEIWRRQ